MPRSRTIPSLLAALAVALCAWAGSASADESPFGQCGYAADVVSQPNGKVVFTGMTGPCGVGPSFPTNYVARLNVDGSLDPSFGRGGVAILGHGAPSGLALRSGGGILFTDETKLYALTSGGEFDPAFPGGGSIGLKVRTTASPIMPDRIVESPDGTIFVTGSTSLGWAVQALNSDGSPNATFNAGEPYTPAFTPPASAEPARIGSGAVEFGDSGEIFIGFGFSTSPASGDGKVGVGVQKLSPAAVPDPTFGGEEGVAVALNASGQASYQRYTVLDLSRRTDGSFDILGNDGGEQRDAYPVTTAFRAGLGAGGSGAELPSTLAPTNSRAVNFSARSDGSFAVAAVLNTSRGDESPSLLGGVRHLPGGVIDSDFGTAGVVSERVGLRSRTSAVDFTPSNGLVLAGSAAAERCRVGQIVAHCQTVIALSRHDSSGRLVSSFGNEGVATFPEILCPRPAGGAETFACGRSVLPRPKVRASFSDRRLSKLIVKVSPATATPDRFKPWPAASLRLPKKLGLRKKMVNSIRVFAGLGRSAKRLPRVAVDYEKGGIRILRSTVQLRDDLRFEIPRRAMKPVRKRLRGRSMKIRATFGWAAESPKTGVGKLRIPR